MFEEYREGCKSSRDGLQNTMPSLAPVKRMGEGKRTGRRSPRTLLSSESFGQVDGKLSRSKGRGRSSVTSRNKPAHMYAHLLIYWLGAALGAWTQSRHSWGSRRQMLGLAVIYGKV